MIRSVIQDFLKKYPNPTDVIDANISVMAKELHSLGLNRERAMKRFAVGFIENWKDVTELYGCGAFASSSFDVFCRGEYKKVLADKKADRNVKAYAAYLKRVCEGGSEGDEDDDGVSKPKDSKKKTTKKRSPPKQRNALPVRKMKRNRKHRMSYKC